MSSTPASAAASSSSSAAASAAASGRKKRSLAGLVDTAILPDEGKLPCPMCDMVLDSQRAYTKHLIVHQRAFDEEEIRTIKTSGSATPKAKFSAAAAAASSSSSTSFTLSDLIKQAGGAVPTNFRKNMKKQRSSGGGDDDEEEDDGNGSEASDWAMEAQTAAALAASLATSSAPPKKGRRKKNADDELSLSEEERRQSALRREQKRQRDAEAEQARLNGGNGAQEAEEEDVRCCLCHSAESDEYNSIVMCDGPCDLPFHQECWGLDTIPKGKWFCSPACKAGRRIDRVEHLSAHRIRYQRLRRRMANSHTPRETAMLNEFWNSVTPYFDEKFLAEHGEELLRRTELERDNFDIPAVGRYYRELWAEEDAVSRAETAAQLQNTSSRSGRQRNNANDAAVAQPPNPSPSPSPVPSSSTLSYPPSAVAAAVPNYFAAEGIDRLHRHLKREPAMEQLNPSEVRAMESIAAVPHTASISVIASIRSTADPPPKEPETVFDPDAREPFDKFAYFFPHTRHSITDDTDAAAVSEPSIVKRQESQEHDRQTLELAAEVIYGKATPHEKRFLTGSHKDKEKKKGAHSHPDQEMPDAAATSSSASPSTPPAASPSSSMPSSSPSPSPSPSSSSSNSKPAASLPISSPTASPKSSSSSATPSASPRASDSESEDKPTARKKKEVTFKGKASPAPSEDEDVEMKDASAASPKPVSGNTTKPMEDERKSERKTGGGKKPRGSNTAAAAAAAATPAVDDNMAEIAAALFGSPEKKDSSRAATGGKKPRGAAAPNKPGIKAPRAKGKDAAAQAKAKSKRKNDSDDSDDDDDEDEDEDDDQEEDEDEEESSSSSSSDDEEDGEGMTLSEEEDLAEEMADAEEERQTEQTVGGKQVPAGKRPRGASGPVTSERVFSIRRAEPEEEEMELEPVEELEAVATLPAPFFDLRSLDFSSARDMGIKLPKPRILKLYHQQIVDNFPFIGVVNPAHLAASCHYAFPPMLYNQHTMQLVELNMRTTATNATATAAATGGEDEEAEESKTDTVDSIPQLAAQIASLQAEMEIIDITQSTSLVHIVDEANGMIDKDLAEQKRNAGDTNSLKFTIAGKGSTANIMKNEGSAQSKSELFSLSSLTDSTASSRDLAHVSVAASYDDEVSAELWLAQRQYLLQVNHNNFTRNYLDVRAHASGSWKSSVAEIEQKEAQDKETEALYDESWLLKTARTQREVRRQKLESSESGQIRNIKRWERQQQRIARHVQRLLKSMVIEVERREKKRLMNERRNQSVERREAKKLRRQQLEAQWKNKRDAEIYKRCENAMEFILKKIEKMYHEKTPKPKKPKDPNAPPRPKKPKKKEPEVHKEDPNALYCICRTPYDNDRLYIGCEVCNDWFHGKCVHITEEQAGEIDAYICEACSKKTGKRTTYLDPKRDRAARRDKNAPEAESAASSEDDEDESDEESEEDEDDELLPPIVISRRKAKKSGRMIFKVVNFLKSDEDEAEEKPKKKKSSKQDEAVAMEIDSDDAEAVDEEEEEEEEEDAINIRLGVASKNTLRLRRMPDADTTTERVSRSQASLHRYEVASLSNWQSLFVKNPLATNLDPMPDEANDLAKFGEQAARRLVRRFRSRSQIYSSLITSKLVANNFITASLAPSERSKHKFSAYQYRFTHFKVVAVDQKNLTITIRKSEDGSRTKNASSAIAIASAAPSSAPIVPAAPKVYRPPTLASFRTRLVWINCPVCVKPCQDTMGLIRHCIRAHPEQPKYDEEQLETFRNAAIEKRIQELKVANDKKARAAAGEMEIESTPAVEGSSSAESTTNATAGGGSTTAGGLDQLAILSELVAPALAAAGGNKRASPSPSPSPSASPVSSLPQASPAGTATPAMMSDSSPLPTMTDRDAFQAVGATPNPVKVSIADFPATSPSPSPSPSPIPRATPSPPASSHKRKRAGATAAADTAASSLPTKSPSPAPSDEVHVNKKQKQANSSPRK